jgi:putative membrane protein
VRLSVAGGLAGLIISLVALPLLVWLFPIVYALVKPVTVPVLLGVLSWGVLYERGWRKLPAAATVLLAGMLGARTLDSVSEPLLPLLSGLFGAPGLLLGIGSTARMPPQQDRGLIAPAPLKTAIPALAGLAASAFVTLFPGLGPAQGAALAELIVGHLPPPLYLILSGAIGTADIAVSLAAAVALGKARNGAIAAAEQLIVLNAAALPALAACAAASAGLGALATLWLAPRIGSWLHRVSQKKLSAAVLMGLAIAVFSLSGTRGLLVLITATAIGTIPVLTGCRRTHAMACLILPVALRA